MSEINKSKEGFPIKWNDLNKLACDVDQIIDLTLIGCKNYQDNKRYKYEKEMYENCDIVIEMIGSSFWQVFRNINFS